jgi:hypothetical protein
MKFASGGAGGYTSFNQALEQRYFPPPPDKLREGRVTLAGATAAIIAKSERIIRESAESAADLRDTADRLRQILRESRELLACSLP